KDGPANRSYGLQVAQLAGVPRGVIAEARRYLEHLEAERDRQRAAVPGADGAAAQTELPLFTAPVRSGGDPPGAAADALRGALAAITPGGLPPGAAREALWARRGLLGAGGRGPSARGEGAGGEKGPRLAPPPRRDQHREMAPGQQVVTRGSRH